MTGEAGGDTEAVVIAYGSNLSPGTTTAWQAFDGVVKTLIGRGLFITKISRLWRSKAWPNPQDPDYVNAIVLARTGLAPHALLARLHEVEREAGRVRDGRRNAPRVLDLDLIAYGDRIVHDGGLVLPHPRAHERAFVMGPLAEIWPDWRHPLNGAAAQTLYRLATIGEDAHPLDAAR